MAKTPKKNPLPETEPDYPTHEVAAELEAGLETIYRDSNLSEMERLDQAHHSTAKKLLVGLTIFFGLLTVISWLGFFFFSTKKPVTAGQQVEVSVTGSDTPKGGEPTDYVIHWKNNDAVALGTASLEIRLPKEFTMLESQAAPQGETATWKIGTLAPGQEGSLSLRGIFLAPADKLLDLQAILTYRPSDFNSEFQKVATKTVKLTGSVLSVTVTGPDKVLPGDKVEADLGYRNDGPDSLDQVKIVAVLPDNFVLEDTDPTLTGNGTGWLIPTLGPGESGQITIHGSFATGAEGERDIQGQIGVLDSNGNFLLQNEASAKATVIQGNLVTALILNGETTSQPVHFGDLLRYAVTWKNTGTVPVSGVTLTAVLDAQPNRTLLDWNHLADKALGIRDGNRISWDKRQVPALARINPGEEGTLEFTVPLGAAPTGTVADANYHVNAGLEAHISQLGDEPVDRTVKTEPLDARLLSDTTMTAAARYFTSDNLTVGSGPLPPQVGEKTTYRVTWEVANSLHELADLRLSAKLPDNVVFTGFSRVDAGELTFDAATNKMMWTLNWLPTSVKTLDVTFDLGLVPTADQHGAAANLLGATIFEATDKATSDSLLETAPPLTTALTDDKQALGKEKVQ